MSNASILAAFEQLAERTTKPFDCAKLGPATAGHSLDVRVLTMAELDDATNAAEVYVAKRYAEGARDPQKVDDAKQLEVICRAFLVEGSPVFPSADWMRERFSTDKLGVLLAAYNKTVRETSLHPSDLSTDAIVALAKRCNADEAAEDLLLVMSRDFLAEAFMRLAKHLEPALPDADVA